MNSATMNNMTTTSEAKNTAFSYLENYSMDADEKITLPVDPVAIASTAGAKVSLADLENVFGVLVHDGEGTRILLERSLEPWLVKFVAAYLLGREAYMLEQNTNTQDHTRHGFVLDSSILSDQEDMTSEEEFADAFAHELLMPGMVMRKYWAKGKSLKWMSSTLGFPQRVIEKRLFMLHLE